MIIMKPHFRPALTRLHLPFPLAELSPSIRRTTHSSVPVSLSSTQRSTGVVSGLPQQTDLLEQYRGLVALGKLMYDPEQVRVIIHLRRLQKDLVDYAPPVLPSRYLNHYEPRSSELDSEVGHEGDSNWWSYHGKEEAEIETRALTRVKSHAEELAELNTPKGLFLTGPPGSGKTMLVDMWLASLPTPYKCRKHYNQLILEIYRAVWEETQRRMTSIQPSSSSSGLSSSLDSRPRWTKDLRERWRSLAVMGALPISWARYSFRLAGTSNPSLFPRDPPIAFVVAKRLLLHHWLLVFDEVQLLDVSSATLLADVLSWFWRMGGVVVGNSNKVPQDLYLGGVARERLERFVDALVARCPVVEMHPGAVSGDQARKDEEESKDWRAIRAQESSAVGRRSWYTLGEREAFEKSMGTLCRGYHHSEPKPQTLKVFGRPLHVPWSMGGICRFTFADLCDQTLGAADYLTIASTYRTVIITDIPVLKLSSKNQARRFIWLIDALYESRCNIICSAEAEPEQLFFPEALQSVEEPETPAIAQNAVGLGIGVGPVGDRKGSAMVDDMDVMMAESVSETQEGYRPNVSSYAEPQMSQEKVPPTAHLALESLSIFSGRDEQFAYKRAVSRLLEMTSASYATEELWTPLPMSDRKWEGHPSFSSTPRSSSITNTTHSTRGEGVMGHDITDFAAEAAYDRASPMSFRERPEAPRIRDRHVWGVGGFDLPDEDKATPSSSPKTTDAQDRRG